MIPRSEYPRPQLRRTEWLCLNGTWQFADDPSDIGETKGWADSSLPDSIVVPFCRESNLSGLSRTDRVLSVWYTRLVEIPPEWNDQRILLHFGAADYETTVWVNGDKVGSYKGGHSSFTLEISRFLKMEGPTRITVRCHDDWRTIQPRGKQSTREENISCYYTRTTGIWQTVWLEPVPESYIKRPRIIPVTTMPGFTVECPIDNPKARQTVEVVLKYGDKLVAQKQVPLSGDFTPSLNLAIPEQAVQFWEPGKPFLYDLEIRLLNPDGTLVDQIYSYAGLRSVNIQGNQFLINGKPVFQKLILDQGYYPDSLLTAPSEEALIQDIEISLQAGFNGARLHQKVFEERFLYHCDRLGYIVWGEFPDWNQNLEGDPHHPIGHDVNFITEWIEVLQRDFNHPSIIGWCPLNEQENHAYFGDSFDQLARTLFKVTTYMDPTRPCLDCSGWSHRVFETHVYDAHDYDQRVESFTKKANAVSAHQLPEDWQYSNRKNLPYNGQPFFMSEFGGMKWPYEEKEGWGYGEGPQTEEQFYQRLDGLCSCLAANPNIFGYCYTQLTDVMQEKNGLFFPDRTPKFDLNRLKKILQI